jgi:hypothetical protein
MTIKTKLTEKDFINVNFVLFYKKIAIRIITVMISLSFILSTVFSFIKGNSFESTQILWVILFLGIVPLMTYFNAKKNYSSNKRISEEIEYRFEENYLDIHGESFNSQYTWDKIYKITQTQNWVLIWHNRQVANPIPKRDIWKGELADLKDIVVKHRVKNNL